MSKLYKQAHRALQDEFGTRRMADKIELREPETIDVQSLPTIQGNATSLSDQVSCDLTCIFRRDSSKHFRS
jgi:hypothetical protein